jgi:hypothetical protein
MITALRYRILPERHAVHTLTLSVIGFDIVLPSTPRYSECSLPVKFYGQEFCIIFLFCHCLPSGARLSRSALI